MFTRICGMMRLLITLLFVSCMTTGYGQSEAIRHKHFNINNNLALEGYDPVSYFDGKPVEGTVAIIHVDNGITYRFSTELNLKKFVTDPEKYQPAYGGWCAYAMGERGDKVKVDPETYKIIAGKLYLFYNFWTTNTLEAWNKNEKSLKAAGDRNWDKIVQ